MEGTERGGVETTVNVFGDEDGMIKYVMKEVRTRAALCAARTEPRKFERVCIFLARKLEIMGRPFAHWAQCVRQ